MKRKRSSGPKKETVKLSISLSEKVHAWALQMCEEGGFDNFSAFIAQLVREELERRSGVPPKPEAVAAMAALPPLSSPGPGVRRNRAEVTPRKP